MQCVLPNQLLSWIKSPPKLASEGWKIQMLKVFKNLELCQTKEL